jgi:hypothetical protein
MSIRRLVRNKIAEACQMIWMNLLIHHLPFAFKYLFKKNKKEWITSTISTSSCCVGDEKIHQVCCWIHCRLRRTTMKSYDCFACDFFSKNSMPWWWWQYIELQFDRHNFILKTIVNGCTSLWSSSCVRFFILLSSFTTQFKTTEYININSAWHCFSYNTLEHAWNEIWNSFIVARERMKCDIDRRVEIILHSKLNTEWNDKFSIPNDMLRVNGFIVRIIVRFS